MLTYALMFLLFLAMGWTALAGLKYDSEKNSFMSLEDSVFLRGFWCLIVILVHVPAAYQNRPQDMAGSFAYIGVTFFFMTSAFGLKYQMARKADYMNRFWQKRLPTLLIPALIANAFGVIVRGFANGWQKVTPMSFLNIDSWVQLLLLCYASFWVVYKFMPDLLRKQRIIAINPPLLCGFNGGGGYRILPWSASSLDTVRCTG